MKQRSKRQKAIIRRRIFLSLCSLALISFVALGVAVGVMIFDDSPSDKSDKKPSVSSTDKSKPQKPKEPYVVSEATVVSIGDIMCHAPQLSGAYDKASKTYDFTAFFKDVAPIFKSADLAIGNLEVTFGGEEKGFKGYPSFNTPDTLADAAKSAGLNLLLTANNHSYDTSLSGLIRTANVLAEKGINFTGTRADTTAKRYAVVDVKGIKIGVVNFTYETTNASSEAGRKYLNGTKIALEANELINSFSYTKIETFYSDAEALIAQMKQDGAEYITFYMHWGEEYQLKQNTWQKSIAQRLSNMGVNLIVGGHPHVVQPIELIHSEDGENTTVCVYSLGNAVSNQRRQLISRCPTGHTEDGLIFSYTLEKYSDGRINLKDVNAIPTWVDKYQGGGGYLYTIYALEGADANATRNADSYNRTMKIIGEGLSSVKAYLNPTETAEPDNSAKPAESSKSAESSKPDESSKTAESSKPATKPN